MERVAGLSAFLRHRRVGVTLALSLSLVWAVMGFAPARGATPRHVAALGPSCSAVANSIAGTATADELITVIASSTREQVASVVLYRREGACFRALAGPYAAFVGINGLSSHHHEGDLTTPIGLYGIEATMYGVLANPGVGYDYHRLVCGDWWNEDPRSTSYNRFVHVACGSTPPFAGDSEALWLHVPQYDYFAAVAYNNTSTVPGRGSGIFLHVSKGHPTTGCISIAKVNLVRVLRLLKPSLHPLIDITTSQLLRG
jgi:L,D-peptidoglycan transpeptidase YkuD (ErfK/YbiS/YcfS/YnhG family)